MTGLMATIAGWDFVLGGVALVVLLIVGLVVVPWIRRRYHPSNIGGLDGESVFDIEGLVRMRRAGLITDEEFRSLRRAALGLDIKAAKVDNSASSAPGGRDDEVSESHPAGPAQQPGGSEDEFDKEL
jgi:hypothetical protein